MAGRLWYPSVDDVLAIHDDIVSEYSATEPGVRSRGDVEFAIAYIEEGNFGTAPESVHRTAYHLLRLLVANHPFVDANKRPALNTTVVFYLLNGYRFEYGDEIVPILKRFGTDQMAVDEAEAVDYLRSQTAEIDLEGEIEAWRDDLVQFGLDELSDDPRDQND